VYFTRKQIIIKMKFMSFLFVNIEIIFGCEMSIRELTKFEL